MTPGERISELQSHGIKLYVQGEFNAANLAWVEANEIAKKAADDACLMVGTRFLSAESWTNGIGHIALLDFFAKRRLLGMCPTPYVVLLKPEAIANRYYLEMWKRYFVMTDAHNVPDEQAVLLQDYPMVLEFEGKLIPFMDAVFEIEQKWRAQKLPPLLKMPEVDVDQGWAKLAEFGIPRDRWFVTIHVRENGAVSGTVDDMTSIRNARLADYGPAVEAIIEAGGHPIRIDRVGAESSVPGMIDVAGAPDWFDVFLISQCRFFMGMNSGPAWVAGTFGVPALLTNWSPSAVRYGFANSRRITKRFRRLDGYQTLVPNEGDKLTYIESGAILKTIGVEAVPTDPFDIRNAAIDFIRQTA